jgi:Ca-activated chloride channel family protein
MRCVGTAILVLLLGALASTENGIAPKVLIPLIVKDSHQRLVSGLTPASLVLSERKTPVTEVSLLRGSDLPLELGLVIDTSSSAQNDGNFKEILGGAKDFVNDIVRGPEDRIFFLTFATKTEATGWLKKEQLGGVSLNVKMGGRTALYDSVAIACRERMGARDWNKPTRRLLIVTSDGDDNLSHITRHDVASEALKSGVVMFTLSTRMSGNRTRGERILEYWARVTGGEYFTDLTRKEIPKVFARIKEMSDGMYYVSYVPPASSNRVHEIEIKPAPKDKLELSYPRTYLWLQ